MMTKNLYDILEQDDVTQGEEETVEETTPVEEDPVEEDPVEEETVEETTPVEEDPAEEETVITVSNELNSAKHNPPGFSVWVGGKVRGDTQNGAVKLDKNSTAVSLTITPEVLVDGNLLTWYYCYGWYSNASIIGPFNSGDTVYVPTVNSTAVKKLFSTFDPHLIPSKQIVAGWGCKDFSICHNSLSLAHFFMHLPTVFWPNFFTYLEGKGISREEFDNARATLHSLPNFTPQTLENLLEKDVWEKYKKAGSLVNYYTLYPDDRTAIEMWAAAFLSNCN